MGNGWSGVEQAAQTQVSSGSARLLQEMRKGAEAA